MKKIVKLKIDNVIVGLLVFATLVSGGILASAGVKADDTTVVDEITVMIPAACSMSGTISQGNEHTDTLMPGEYKAGIGTTDVQVFCNDFAGFAVYAVGFSGTNGEATNRMVGTNSGQMITTGTATSGDTSQWAMKLIKVTNPGGGAPDITYHPENLTILDNYDSSSYHAVPATYDKVLSYTAASGPATTDTTLGSKFQTTYAVFASATQAADTYVGKVKYLLVHPATVVPGNYTLVYDKNGGTTGTMNSETVSNLSTHTLANNAYGAPSGYSFAGWCTIQDTSATAQNPQTSCRGMSYANGATLPASPDASATSGGTFTLFAYWKKN